MKLQGVNVVGYEVYLQKTIDHIEENIREPITIEGCAAAAGFSKYHFYRLFTMYVGVPLMEYVRKRRLSYAMQDINHGRRILDVALDYGYRSERAFCRAFQREYGDTPGKFRNRLYALPQKPILVETQSIDWGGLNMEYQYSDVRIEKLDTMRVASARVISPKPEEDVIAFMDRWREANHIDPLARNFGFDIPVSEEEGSQGLRGYEYWVEVPEEMQVSEGVRLKKVEGATYAILRITNPFSSPFEVIPEGWRRLAAWANEHGYMPISSSETGCKDRYWLEEILELDGTTNMDLYFPLD
jgi:AraC family transcriptional regulator